jgi:hypothetical protein
MKNLAPSLLLLLFVTSACLNAQTKADEDAVRKLPPSFLRRLGEARWSRTREDHDVDFVTVPTVYLA